MLIQTIPVSQINPAPYNPRQDLKPGDVEYEKLNKSMSEFGCVEPLVWNKRTGHLAGGHQRFKILIAQGAQEIVVSVVDLPLEKEKALNLALNKIQGDWDEDKLAQLISDLSATPDFDVSLTGFDMPEVSEILDRFQERQGEDDYDVQADVDSNKESITKNGDVIELGKHRVICGDSSDPETLKKLIGQSKVNLLHTDPPYNVNYYGGNRPHVKARPKDSKQWDRIYCDDMSQDEYEVWLKNILTYAAAYLTEGAPVYIWNGHLQFGPMHHILTGLGFHIGCVITWAKPNFAIGYGDYNQQTEFCLYGWKEGETHFWNGPTNESTLWEINRDPAKILIHPTQKPIAIAQRAITNSSCIGDIVLDLFLGSGSTLIAAESLGRVCYGCEKDARYIDAIVRRYIAFVGKDKVSDEIKAKYLKEPSNA